MVDTESFMSVVLNLEHACMCTCLYIAAAAAVHAQVTPKGFQKASGVFLFCPPTLPLKQFGVHFIDFWWFRPGKGAKGASYLRPAGEDRQVSCWVTLVESVRPGGILTR